MSSNNDCETSSEEKVEYKLYRRRWFMIFIFVFFSAINSSQWIQYAIINNIVTKYYNVEDTAVNWTSTIFMVTYIPLIFPASYLTDKKGLRWTLTLGTLGTLAGSCIKIASLRRDLFWVTFIGQTLTASSQVFMLGVSPSIAAAWFGPNEVSTACSIGVFGNLFGNLLGFLLPPIIVKNHDNVDGIGTELGTLFYGTAAFAVTVFILTVLFFQARPPTPPSPQQALQKENASKNNDGLLNLFKRLLRNKGYVTLLIAFSINQGIYNTVSTFFNQLILTYFEDGEELAGRIGVVFVITGTLSGVLFGFILDLTHRFKEVTLAVYALSLVGMLAFTFTLALQSEPILYTSTVILGTFVGGYIPIAYDLSAEITYPEPEGMTTGFFTVVPQIISTFYNLAYEAMISSLGPMWSNVALCVTLLIGTILHIILRPDLRRKAVTASKENIVET